MEISSSIWTSFQPHRTIYISYILEETSKMKTTSHELRRGWKFNPDSFFLVIDSEFVDFSKFAEPSVIGCMQVDVFGAPNS